MRCSRNLINQSWFTRSKNLLISKSSTQFTFFFISPHKEHQVPRADCDSIWIHMRIQENLLHRGFLLIKALSSIDSTNGFPPLFVDFFGTMTLSDFPVEIRQVCWLFIFTCRSLTAHQGFKIRDLPSSVHWTTPHAQGLRTPLPTLHLHPHGYRRIARGQSGWILLTLYGTNTRYSMPAFPGVLSVNISRLSTNIITNA